MPTHRSIALAAACLMSFAAAAQQAVTVAFQDRDRYADAVHGLPELQRHLEKQAARHIGAGQKLALTFTGVDRAGHETPAGTRVVRDLEPARIELEFALVDASGKRIREGRRRLRSPAFFVDSRLTDPLHYEKTLLDDWLKREFGPARV